jgi:hypothetical protein
MERVNFTLSELHIKRLKALAKKMQISMSEALRRLIDSGWEESKKKGR